MAYVCQNQQGCAFGFLDIYYIQVVGIVLGGILMVLDVPVVQARECCLLTARSSECHIVGFIKGLSQKTFSVTLYVCVTALTQ